MSGTDWKSQSKVFYDKNVIMKNQVPSWQQAPSIGYFKIKMLFCFMKFFRADQKEQSE